MQFREKIVVYLQLVSLDWMLHVVVVVVVVVVVAITPTAKSVKSSLGFEWSYNLFEFVICTVEMKRCNRFQSFLIVIKSFQSRDISGFNSP